MATVGSQKSKSNPRINDGDKVGYLLSNLINSTDSKKINALRLVLRPVLDNLLNPTKVMVPRDTYSIYFNGNSFDINFGENYKINVNKSNGMKLTIYFLKHPDSNDSLTVIREKLQLKLSDDNFDNTVKNIRDNILDIQKMEMHNPAIMKIPPDKRFSDYLSKYIRFNYSSSERRTLINSHMNLKWESLPEEF
jgi:hypothetical protein